jgi:nitroreductase
MLLEHNEIKKNIIKSQHCQRNWDLTKSMPKEDLDLLVFAATNCPSKQNVAFYNVHVITNRDLIEKIHSTTSGFDYNGKTVTNSQTLANTVFVFTENKGYGEWFKNAVINDQQHTLERDRHMATGVAAGYLNLLASMLGYSTGCCACFNNDSLKSTLNIDSNILLIMGIGFNDSTRNRRIHHADSSFVFPTIPKEHVQVTYIE